MATTASSYSIPLRWQKIISTSHDIRQLSQPLLMIAKSRGRRRRRSHCIFRAFSAQQQEQQKTAQATSGVDTRIHWENEDEGWVGGGTGTSSSSGSSVKEEEEDLNNTLGDRFSDLLNSSSDSHYQFLGVAVDADLEQIKGAYRRLSKEYHPDTTSLPIKAASEKFMKLREIYDVLSDEEKRKFYDWTLAQEAASREMEKMRMKLEDPFMKEIENYESVPDLVDRLGGKNIELSDQAMTALTFDIFIIIFAIFCIIYVLFFKEPYY